MGACPSRSPPSRSGLGPVTAAEVVAVARHGVTVQVAEDALVEVRRTRAVIEALADDPQPHYGVSTGFGALATRHIPTDDAHPAAAQPDPLPRRGLRPGGRASRWSGP